jgi:hypothetical protein
LLLLVIDGEVVVDVEDDRACDVAVVRVMPYARQR